MALLNTSIDIASKIASNVPHRYKLSVQYNGSRYRGWQTQPFDAHPSSAHSSIQAALTKALEHITGNQEKVIISGRTDAGVHAIENVCHVDILRQPKSPSHPLREPFDAKTLKLALNGALKEHPSILITKVERVTDQFHARFSATERTYCYRIITSTDCYGRPFEGYGRWFLNADLDLDKMNQACAILQGYHDFSTFRKAGDQANPIRTLKTMKVVRDNGAFLSWTKPLNLEHLTSSASETSAPTQSIAQNYVENSTKESAMQQFIVVASAQSFMTHQVRKMVSGVVEVGRGRTTVEKLKEALDSKNPAKCPSMAPAHGLFLCNIKYPAYEILDSSG